MKHSLLGLIALFLTCTTVAQENPKKIYFTEPGELIFQFSQSTIENNTAKNGVRTSYFTNVPAYMHINFNNNIGLMPGISIRNIGIKTKDEQIFTGMDTITYDIIKRRVFTGGVSCALKIGSFQRHLWAYAGGGMDWAFHYRQKLYESGHNKKVTKEGEWLSNATPTTIPSVFVGIQTPYGLNFKATYYFNDFLNQNYNGHFGDFSKISKSQLFTISVSLVIKDMKTSLSNDLHMETPSRKEKSVEL